ncbi:Zinc-binding dehydrogenase protein [Rutstroemia sp. NJR-2017a BVV2]|nr:Zinc-binding dehydrogenase protein [Rutstroemia sp. NJR-2017a BVV2]
MSTHAAVVTTSVRGPLEILQLPTVTPAADEVRVKVEWVASTPLDLHQNDGGLLVTHPQVLGDAVAGTVEEVGSEVKNLVVGDKVCIYIVELVVLDGSLIVFGFMFREQKEKAEQEYVTVSWYMLGKIPAGVSMQHAVTLPTNLVTVFHTLTADLGLELPWPRPSEPEPKHGNDPILVWGGSSSVGQYAIQVLRHWGYKNIITTSSKAHHSFLKELGASHTLDYRDSAVIENIIGASSKGGQPSIPFIFDCIGSQHGSLAPIAKVAQKGTKVAILLPVIVKDATDDEAPQYSMDVNSAAPWAEGVEARGVRTHFYLQNEFFKNKLQSEIMPTLLADGAVRPNNYRVIEGKTLLERAQRALDTLRRKEVSGERLVWRVSE